MGVYFGFSTNLQRHLTEHRREITILREQLEETKTESPFVSRLFRFGLWLLGIRHQKTDLGCPWMNGRIERFFGTLKRKLDFWEVDDLAQLNGALGQFQLWYNHA